MGRGGDDAACAVNPGGADVPAIGAFGDASARPLDKGRDGGLVQRVFGPLKIANACDKGRDEAAPVGPKAGVKCLLGRHQ